MFITQKKENLHSDAFIFKDFLLYTSTYLQKQVDSTAIQKKQSELQVNFWARPSYPQLIMQKLPHTQLYVHTLTHYHAQNANMLNCNHTRKDMSH